MHRVKYWERFSFTAANDSCDFINIPHDYSINSINKYSEFKAIGHTKKQKVKEHRSQTTLTERSDLLISVCRNVVGVDGPDGVGKSSFCSILLREALQRVEACIIRVTAFDTTTKASEIGSIFENAREHLPENSLYHNRFFLRATRFNYRYAVKQLSDRGAVVILDSSELRCLAYIYDKGQSDAYRETLAWFVSGRLTAQLTPSVRVILGASPEDLLDNICGRGDLDHGDPTNLPEVVRRIEAYRNAVKLAKALNIVGTQKTMEYVNPRSSNPGPFLTEIAQHILKGVIDD